MTAGLWLHQMHKFSLLIELFAKLYPIRLVGFDMFYAAKLGLSIQTISIKYVETILIFVDTFHAHKWMPYLTNRLIEGLSLELSCQNEV